MTATTWMGRCKVKPRLESNQGPRDYESPALTVELRGHYSPARPGRAEKGPTFRADNVSTAVRIYPRAFPA